MRVYRCTHRRRGKKWPIILSVIIFCLVLGFLHLKLNINPLVKKASQSEASSKVSMAISQTTKNELLGGAYEYTSFVNIVKDSSDNVVVVQINSVLVSVLSSSISLAVQERVDELEGSIKIPLGVFSGITVLSGLGRDINISVGRVGTVKSVYESSFEEAGLNQTRHRIYLTIQVELLLVLPGEDYIFFVSEQIILCESIIVGKVPSFYFNS